MNLLDLRVKSFSCQVDPHQSNVGRMTVGRCPRNSPRASGREGR